MIAFVLITVSLVWAVCGFFAYGYCFAYYQREFWELAVEDKKYDRAFACTMAFCGPVGLISVVKTTGTKHGLLWR